MKLNKKLFLLLLTFTISFIVMIFILNNIVFMKGYYELEKEYSKIEYKRAINEFNDYKKRLELILNDWAQWDDTYKFIDDSNSYYIKSNIIESTFEDIGIDYIVLLNDDNNVVYSGSYNYDSNSVYNNVDTEIMQLIKNAKNGSEFYYANNKTLVISKSDVTDSEGVSKSNGKIIFAYYLIEDEVIDKLNDGDSEVYYIENSDILFNEEYIINKYDNKTNLVFFVPYQNVNKAIRVQMNFSNKISNLGRKTSINILLFYIVFVIIMVTILLVLLNKFIIKRVIIMNGNIKAITESGDITKRLIVKDNNKDEISQLVFSFNNMLEKIEYLQEDLVNFATIDNLTKIYNSRVGLEKLETLMYMKDEKNQPLTICYLDVNNLKIVNDKLGHNIGNQLLIDVVKIIKQNIRNLDYLSRLGGDEFLLVLPNLTLLESREVMKRINKKIESFNALPEREYIISISFGIVEYDGKENLDELIIRADRKMYKHKTLIKKNTNDEVDMKS